MAKTPHPTDFELLHGLALGEADTILKMRKQYFPPIQKWILTNSGSHEDAEDIFEESLVVLYEYSLKESFQLNTDLSVFLFSIVKRKWLKTLNKRKKFNLEVRNEELEVLSSDDITDEAIIYSEKLEFYRSVFSHIGEECRRLLSLVFEEQKSSDEIMKFMNFGSLSYLYKRKSMCKSKLIELIKNHPLFKEFK